MGKKEAKDFYVFCHTDEEGRPVVHRITINETGSVKIHDHPELQSEVYYNLLMVQKEKGEGSNNLRYSYRGYAYPVKGCLQFYFSLIHKKFDSYMKGIYFQTLNENHIDFDRYDNQRIEDYLEKIKLKTLNRTRFNREDVWSEEAFLKANLQRMKFRRENIVNTKFGEGTERFHRYNINFDLSIVGDHIESSGKSRGTVITDKFAFRSFIGSRCSTSRSTWRKGPMRREGSVTVSLTITKDWFKEVNKAGLAVVETKKHGKFFVAAAMPYDGGYLVHGVVPNKGTTKKYIVQKFHIKRNPVDGTWDATRKNKVRTWGDSFTGKVDTKDPVVKTYSIAENGEYKEVDT
jgi:hypothetical protein